MSAVKNIGSMLGVVAHALNPGTEEVEAGGSLRSRISCSTE